MIRTFDRLAGLIAPHNCLVCNREGDLLCADCRANAVITKRPTCYRCNALSDGGKTCKSCRSSSALSGVVVASHYDGQVKELIGRLKFQQTVAAAETLAGLLYPLLDPAQFDLVVAVPAASSRYRARGYNQAELIAKALASKLALPYLRPLVRLGYARQLGQSRQKRIEQMNQAFAAKPTPLVQNACILLVDDVLTTGATLNACATELKKAGAKSVWGAVAAKH